MSEGDRSEGSASDGETYQRPYRVHRLNDPGAADADAKMASRSRRAHVLRDDSAKYISSDFCAVESSSPESCRTALPTETAGRTDSANSALLLLPRLVSPRNVRTERVSGSFETISGTVKQLQRLRWSLDDFKILGRLGGGRVSTVRRRFSCAFLRRSPE